LNDTLRERTEFRRYQAPRQHGQALIEPALAAAPQMLRRNIECLDQHGQWLQRIRRSARRELIRAAVRYTSAYRDTAWVDQAQAIPIVMAGHQPALFHGGVWFKNFALSQLAKTTGSIAVNLIVDNDAATTSSIRVPMVDERTGIGTYRVIAYDRPPGGVPYEQTTIRDRHQFDSFDKHVAAAIKPLVATPCVNRLWDHARAAVERCGVAGCALAQARHGLEGELGLRTLELPLGVMCRSVAFAQFVDRLVSELPQFHQCYNRAADHYRIAHGIRSSAHPVPNLAEQDQWLEAPLWIYGDDRPERRAAWVCRRGDQLVISDRQGCEVSIDAKYPHLAAEQLVAQGSPTFKLRPRALLTTMYARLVLSDLFLHGIGGGKYDQLGDLIIRDFFGIEPPAFMVISATTRLPGIAGKTVEALNSQAAALKREIRDCEYQGERFVDQVTLSPLDVQHKRQLLAEIPPAGQRWSWQREIEAVNRRLADQLAEYRTELTRRLAKVQQDQKAQTILAGREHPFCLFPLDYLTGTYQGLLSH